MCSAPKIEQPQKLQQSKEPVFNDSERSRMNRGRRGTILTGGAGDGGAVTPTAVTGKKTLLGS